MNKNPEHFIQHLKAITLGDEKRRHMREALLSYVDLHSISEVAPETYAPLDFFAFFKNRRAVYALALMLIVVAGGSSAAFAAEGTLPGDALYGIKIHVNEPLAETFAATPEAKARVDATLAERRVDEATSLATKGKLNDETAAYLEIAVKQQVDKSDAQAQVIADAGDTSTAADVRADLENSLATHAQALAAVSNDSEDSTGGAARVLAVLAERTHTVALARAKSQNEASTTLAINDRATVNLSALRAHVDAQQADTVDAATLSIPTAGVRTAALFSVVAKMQVGSTTATTTATSTLEADEGKGGKAEDARSTPFYFGQNNSGNQVLPESMAPKSAAQ